MKKIVLSGWWLSFEKECEYYIKYEQVSGFNKIHKIEIEGESQSYKESDFIAIDKGNKIFKFLLIHEPSSLWTLRGQPVLPSRSGRSEFISWRLSS